MREIKFRGKRIDNGQWVCGQLRFYDNDFCEIMESGEKRQTCHVDGKPFYQSFAKVYEVDPATVGQYTGLKDKNGVEIFEGDILSCGDGNVPTLITWHDESHAYYAYNLKRKEHHRLDKFFLRYIGLVIGNIHDNPELLEVD